MNMITISSFNNAPWRKSSRSGGTSNCIEVASNDRAIGVRDSKDPNGPVLTVTPEEWMKFLTVVHVSS